MLITTKEAAKLISCTASMIKYHLTAIKQEKRGRGKVNLYDKEDVLSLLTPLPPKLRQRHVTAPYRKKVNRFDDPHGVMTKLKLQKRRCPDCGAQLYEGQYKCKDCTDDSVLETDDICYSIVR